MKSTSILVALFAICALWANPSTTEASSAYMINDTTAVFFVDFAVNASYGDFMIPVVADHTVMHNDRVDVLGYELVGSDQQIATVSDIVLSSADLSDARYTIQQGTQAAFTLLSIVRFDQPITTDVTLAITKLPFWVNGTRTSLHQNQIDELDTVTAAH